MADPIEIAPGERETLISAGNVREFFADVRSDVELFLSETFSGTGERCAPDDRGKLGASRGTEVIAYNPGTEPARIELSPTGRRVSLATSGFYFDRQTRVTTQVLEEQNRNAWSVIVHDPSADGTQLPTNTVPDGFSVTVQAVGGTLDVWPTGSPSEKATIRPGRFISLNVSDTDLISVDENTTGATAEVTFES